VIDPRNIPLQRVVGTVSWQIAKVAGAWWLAVDFGDGDSPRAAGPYRSRQAADRKLQTTIRTTRHHFEAAGLVTALAARPWALGYVLVISRPVTEVDSPLRAIAMARLREQTTLRLVREPEVAR